MMYCRWRAVERFEERGASNCKNAQIYAISWEQAINMDMMSLSDSSSKENGRSKTPRVCAAAAAAATLRVGGGSGAEGHGGGASRNKPHFGSKMQKGKRKALLSEISIKIARSKQTKLVLNQLAVRAALQLRPPLAIVTHKELLLRKLFFNSPYCHITGNISHYKNPFYFNFSVTSSHSEEFQTSNGPTRPAS